VPALVELQLRLAVPEPVTVAGVIVLHVSPDSKVSLSVTFPANPLTAATVIVEVDEEPTGVEPGELAVIVKSTNANMAVAVCRSEPAEPVIVTV